AALTLFIKRTTRISPAVVLLSIPIGFALFSSVSGFTVNRLSNILFGDPTFTGRTVIWDFVDTEIARRPLIGWGYQSFWLVGPDAPSIVDAPGFVKAMPNAHNGYKDTMLELGYVGLAFALACSVRHHLQLPREPLDAGLRSLVGAVFDRRSRGRAILAAFSFG